jgi:hypothetical protein
MPTLNWNFQNNLTHGLIYGSLEPNSLKLVKKTAYYARTIDGKRRDFRLAVGISHVLL